jgi:hypothetical protein
MMEWANMASRKTTTAVIMKRIQFFIRQFFGIIGLTDLLELVQKVAFALFGENIIFMSAQTLKIAPRFSAFARS